MRLVAAATLCAAGATSVVAWGTTARQTDATFTDAEAGQSSVTAARIATPSGFRCWSVLGLLGARATWPAASPSVSAPYSYRYVVQPVVSPDRFATTAAAPSITLPANLLNIGVETLQARAELLRSGTPLWTSGSGKFVPNSILIETDC